MATGDQGEAAVLSGGTWHAVPPATAHPWNDVSCASTTSCMTVATDGSVAHFDGVAWSGPVTPVTGMRLTGVSCASVTWCAAVGFEGLATGYVTTWTGTGWSTPVLVDPYRRGLTIDCPAVGACVLGGNGTDAAALSDGSWSAPVQVDPAGVALLVGCRSVTSCVGVDWAGNAATFDGTTWSAPAPFDPLSGTVTGLSCVAGDDCVLVDQQGYAAVRAAGVWSAPTPVGGATALSAVSCATATFCLAAGTFRDSPASPAYVGMTSFDGQRWSAPVHAGTGISYLSAVACPSSQFCMTVGERPSPDGFVAVAQTWNGRAWSDPAQLDLSGAPRALTCLSDTFCMAAAGGVVWRWANGTWTRDQPSPGNRFPAVAIACFTETSCLVVSFFGDVYRWLGTGWAAEPGKAPNGTLGLACPSSTYCLATQGNGSRPEIADFDGATWSTTVPLPGVVLASMAQPAIPACGTTCYVATPDGHVVTISH
jgi:hypothetical protein